jgi:hypothetical protein
MRTNAAVCLPAALAVFALLTAIIAPGGNASPDTGICDGCSSAVGTVNVTLVESPPFTGMFMSSFDFHALAEAFFGFLSAVSSAFSAS